MKVLGEPFFLQFGVPLIAVSLSIFLKFVTRNDGHVAFRKEDLAIGFDLAATATLLFVTASATIAQSLIEKPDDDFLIEKAASVPWMLGAYILSIWAMSTIVRKLGWEEQDQLKWFWGIILPMIFGLLLLFFTVNWMQL